MTKLSVNINKLATIRNARGKNNPNIINWASKIESYGAHGITVHPRPDERHIRKTDVFELKKVVSTELNIEGYPSPEFLDLIKKIRPDQCTLVPDPPEVLTSNAGWKIKNSKELIKKSAKIIKDCGVRLSLFVEPKTCNLEDLEYLKFTGVDRIEMYTEDYARDNTKVVGYKKLAQIATSVGLELNAGHDLNLKNLSQFITAIPEVKEVSIGHALICEALEFGMKDTIEGYLKILSDCKLNPKPSQKQDETHL
jgi:pyridoxine 5-phosphate synthase